MLPPNVSWAYDMHYLGSFVLLLSAFFLVGVVNGAGPVLSDRAGMAR